MFEFLTESLTSSTNQRRLGAILFSLMWFVFITWLCTLWW